MDLKDYFTSINTSKEDLMQDLDSEKSYPVYAVNRCLSGFPELVGLVNEINQRPMLDNKMQYHFYLHVLPAKKRYAPWIKKEKLEDLDYIMQYFNCGVKTAKEYLTILSKGQIETIKKKLNPNG